MRCWRTRWVTHPLKLHISCNTQVTGSNITSVCATRVYRHMTSIDEENIRYRFLRTVIVQRGCLFIGTQIVSVFLEDSCLFLEGVRSLSQGSIRIALDFQSEVDVFQWSMYCSVARF